MAETGAPRAPLGYRPALDGVRAVAIAAVVGLHYFGWPRDGRLGVDLFFVLSGFLITTILLEERDRRGRISLGVFYLRRCLRLYPALLVLLIATLGATTLALGPSLHDAVRMVALGATYTTNVGLIWARGWVQSPETGPLWSLAVEEQFYLLWPFCLLLLLRLRRPAPRIAIVCAAIAAIAIVRFALGPSGPGQPTDVATVTRFDSVLIGCVFALAYASDPVRLISAARSRRVWPVVAVIVGYFVVVSDPRVFWSGRSALFCIAAGLLILGVLDGRSVLARCLSTRPLVYLGKISYPLYLWHVAVLTWFARAHGLERLGSSPGKIVALLLAIGIAAASYEVVERPFLRLKHRLTRTATSDALAAEMPVPAPTRMPAPSVR